MGMNGLGAISRKGTSVWKRWTMRESRHHRQGRQNMFSFEPKHEDRFRETYQTILCQPLVFLEMMPVLPFLSRLLQFRHPTVDIFGGILMTNGHIRLQQAHGVRVLLNGNHGTGSTWVSRTRRQAFTTVSAFNVYLAAYFDTSTRQ